MMAARISEHSMIATLRLDLPNHDSRVAAFGHPYRTFAGRRHSRCPIVEAKKWIAVTGKLEFANNWAGSSHLIGSSH
jgi:hypothetical protein